MGKYIKRPLAVLRLRGLRRMGDFILKIGSIVFDIGQHPAKFPSPNPSLALVTQHLNELESAETEAKSRTVGAVQARNLKYDVVLQDARSLMAYVQSLADAEEDPAVAREIIALSGFSVKDSRGQQRWKFTAQRTAIAGQVKLRAESAGKGDAHEWQYSTDKGTSWIALPSTLQASTVAGGFKPGTEVLFRHRHVSRKETKDWSQAISIIVG